MSKTNIENNSVDKDLAKRWWYIPFVLLGLGLAFVLIGIGVYSILNHHFDESFCNTFVAIYSGVAGGLVALFGVLITIFKEISFRNKDIIEKSVPEFFMPMRYDIKDADMIRLYKNEELSGTIPNTFLYFKNTDKTPFAVSTLKILIEGKPSVFYSCETNYYADKNKLFCLCFNCDLIGEHAVINVISIDKQSYSYSLNLYKKTITRI